ncbi:atp synthase mitochondrial f1 complex assembly factor 2/atp12 protein mitochondrial precursor [Holotrichia oblita]|uniref:Atp synthase mitochondrial f1 complex assembly factor 2/atp12 protein mitochondrial n=1 Tax=Holotrichia oblita TaxID=644536 RepID=A0ACB9TF55_HOLOL|nr:atp synthase mitochondrial f1 complex assembly factor 2/atp12 protein mitochondrial precursor [Holotrichia oblita]
MEVMKNKSKLRNKLDNKVFINDDLTREERDIQRIIRQKAKEEKSKGKQVKIGYAKLVIEGYVYGVDTLKSVILTLACVEKYLTPERAVILSRLEEEFQLGYWGRVEWAHDLNQQDLQSRLSAAVLYIYCNSSSHLMKIKASLEN